MRGNDDGDDNHDLDQETGNGWGDSLDGDGRGDGAGANETGDQWGDDCEPHGDNLASLVDEGDGP